MKTEFLTVEELINFLSQYPKNCLVAFEWEGQLKSTNLEYAEIKENLVQTQQLLILNVEHD